MAITEATVTRLIGSAGQVCTILMAGVTPALDPYREVVLAALAPYALYGDGNLVIPCYLEEKRVNPFLVGITTTSVEQDFDLYLHGNPTIIENPDAWAITDVRLVKTGQPVHDGLLKLVGVSRPAPVLTILKLKAV